MRADNAADIAIVGAGAAGLAFAWAVAAPEVRVVVIEAGDAVDQRRSPSVQGDWELALQTRFNANPNLRRGPADYPVDDAQSPIRPAIFNSVGGSTIRWGAHFPRMRPSDFQPCTLDGVGRDWPIGYDDLVPWYDLNDHMMGVSGLAGDPANPPRSTRPCPPLPLCPGTLRLAKGFDRLGWHWWPSDVAILSAARPDHARDACNGCGPCGVGCPRHARASADIAYLGAAQAAGVQLWANTTVTGLRLSPDGGRVLGLDYAGPQGSGHLSCGQVVLAGNALGNARLLAGRVGHPLLGRGLMLHPTAIVTGLFDDDLRSWRGAFAGALVSQEFYETNASRDFVRGFQMQALRGQGPLGTALGGYGTRLPWGRGHSGRFAAAFGRNIALTVTCDDLPEDDNRIEADRSKTCAAGLPVPRMIYRVGENTRRMLAFGIERASEALRAAGAREVSVTPLSRNAGFHLMGTARMGQDPATSVTDHTGRVHGMDNLSIVDASVFVSAGPVNPTPTLQAIALRAAAGMRARLGLTPLRGIS